VSDEPDERTARIVTAIQHYLASHPRAADSEQGIGDWWLPAMGVAATSSELAAAIRHLERRGALTRQVLADGKIIYRARAT